MVVPDGVCINSLPCFSPRSSDFVAQCGDPTGTGEGGESSYGQPFKVQCLSLCVCRYACCDAAICGKGHHVNL